MKDMYDIAGERTGGGSSAWLAAQTAERHSAVVQAVLDAGATITGKTIAMNSSTACRASTRITAPR